MGKTTSGCHPVPLSQTRCLALDFHREVRQLGGNVFLKQIEGRSDQAFQHLCQSQMLVKLLFHTEFPFAEGQITLLTAAQV